MPENDYAHKYIIFIAAQQVLWLKSADRYSATIFVLNFFRDFDYIYLSISSLKPK